MNTQQAKPTPELIEGLSSIVDRYDALIIDAWGVIHDGVNLYPGVASTLAKLHHRKVPVIVVSNAARRAENVLESILDLGVSREAIHGVVSSGEVFWQAAKSTADGFDFSGKTCFYLGPERSLSVLHGLDLTLCEDVCDADVIINTGLVSQLDTLINEEPILQKAITRDIPMICLNPDLVAVRDGVKGYSAGSVATRYIELGANDVRWVGKPYAEIYAAAMALMPEVSKRRVLAIGDAIRTDITGANTAHIDSLFITGGIHQQECDASSSKSMQGFFSKDTARPTYYCKGLVW